MSRSRYTPITSIYIPGISITHNLNGASNANSLMLFTTTSWRCLYARLRIAPSDDRGNRESFTTEDRPGDSRARANPFLPLHGALSLRSRTRILFPQRGAVWQGRRFLYLKRCSRRVRTVAGTAV